MRIILVTGGRDYADRQKVFETLDWLHPEAVMHGQCETGADHFADQWCLERGVPVIRVPALWDALGDPAGPRRNAFMASLQIATGVCAFPGGRGTRDMIKRAREWSVPVYQVADSLS